MNAIDLDLKALENNFEIVGTNINFTKDIFTDKNITCNTISAINTDFDGIDLKVMNQNILYLTS